MSAAEALRPAHNDRPLKIALLGYRSNPYSGGQGVYVKFLSRALVEAGHQVDVISGEPYPDLCDEVRLIKLPGLNLYAHDNHVRALRPGHFRSATDLFEYFSTLTGGFPEPYTFGRRLVRQLGTVLQDYDLIHDNQSLCHGLIDLQKRRLPLVCTIHHPITWDRDIALAHASKWGDRLLIRRWHHFLAMQTKVARRLKHIVTVSESSRRDISSAFDLSLDRIAVVYNGIDSETFRPEPAIERKPNQLITTASADAPLKGTQHLIPAFAKLRAHYPDLKLTFIGRPKTGGKTENLIRQYGVGDAIRFVHGISTDQIRALYAESTVAVVPSEYEGFGLPAGEAMACQVPVVSTDGGALPEVVGDAGIIVPVGDVNGLAAGIARFLDDPDLRARQGVQGRQRVQRLFNWERTAQQMTAYYRQVLE
ncbi:MAG: glycosyltransferase family 4 protein [Proteobacteria bacterium]|nr:glycosyltransferase family 4 protein [Pseudomonadota bacterium]